ncbi:hypothetical protein BDP27DRAFT_1012890 [Rhodocollybia butyracea]|uniref:YTH domain-containing protein n=1 Tax=Rhodocollybia butyracea TaxID=206335 RepID=A0A9P5PNN9_9AGAR|nr:hypothetical protein BDP27DRAFT_1012890 [Rhodocollybia butyracea]
MVESVSSQDILRNLTPKPNPFQQVRISNTQESFPEFGGDSSESAKDSNIGITASFMPGDVSGRGMPDKAGGTNRRSSSHQTNQPRRPAQNATPPSHFPPENPLGPPQVPSPNYAPSSQYGQRSGFFGQYTMSTQSPMGMPPATPQYAYPHGYQSVPDNTMISQNIHASYQPLLPPAPVYPYQQPPDGQPMYAQQGSTSPSPPMSSTSSQNPTPPYPSHGQFHSLRYPSSISPSQYSYSFPTSPVYQSQYAPAPYPQHYTSPPEVDGQGGWWYLPHANPPSYPGHYHYSPVHQEMENTYPASSAAVPAPLPAYPMSPVRPSTILTSADRPGSSVSSTSPSPVPHPSSSRSATGDRSTHAVRRPYHPNPPSHRSEWVMWAGNVPSDATHDELWRFFTQTEEPSAVLSIFLISRSSCAFVNYESDDDLQAAIAQFNGVPLRPHDSRCPRLVCRVRKIDDDLRAGVGGQRGVGMHSKWVKDQREKTKGKGKAAERFDQSDQDDSSSSNAALSASVSSDDESRPYFVKPTHSNSSGSYASTNSSLLSRHFPKRYFILKSLSQYDLDLSVEKNLWATQKHNEGILDQSYRTSNEVYLIFSVNKSGEFYGYAK